LIKVVEEVLVHLELLVHVVPRLKLRLLPLKLCQLHLQLSDALLLGRLRGIGPALGAARRRS
jgi:hypothetical protein